MRVSKFELYSNLQKLHTVVGNTTIVPLDHVRLHKDRLYATDRQVAVALSLDVEEFFEDMLVPYKRLLQISKPKSKLDRNTILDFIKDGFKIEIAAGEQERYTLHCSTSEYPTTESLSTDCKNTCTVPTYHFILGLEYLLRVSNYDPNREFTQLVLLRTGESATVTSERVYVVKDLITTQGVSMALQKGDIRHLLSLFKKRNLIPSWEEMTLSVYDNHVMIIGMDFSLTIVSYDTNAIPDYKHITPNEFAVDITCQVSDLKQALDGIDADRVNLSLEENDLILSTDTKGSSCRRTIALSSSFIKEETDPQIGVNPKFIRDALLGSACRIQYNPGTADPIIITHDEGYALLAPMKVL